MSVIGGVISLWRRFTALFIGTPTWIEEATATPEVVSRNRFEPFRAKRQGPSPGPQLFATWSAGWRASSVTGSARASLSTEEKEFLTDRVVAELERNRRRYDKFLPIERPKKKRAKRSTAQKHRPSPKSALPELIDLDPAVTDPLGDALIVQQTSEGDDVRIAESELYGVFNFRDTILDQLEHYFIYIKRMKKRDKHAFGYYRQVGATIVPFAALSHDRIDRQFLGAEVYGPPKPTAHLPTTLPTSFLQNLPAFGCIAYGTDGVTEKIERERQGKRALWVPKFLYFTKHKVPPSTIQPCSGATIYTVTVWWDRPFDQLMNKKMGRAGTPQQYAVAVEPNGTIRALKVMKSEHTTFSVKSKKGHRREVETTWKKWAVPDYFTPEDPTDTPRHQLERLFAEIANWHESSRMADFRVSVKKGDLVASFGLNARRAPYFFADRAITASQQGRTVPIFHFVRPHRRSNGSLVKAHYRGLRRFQWGDYEVIITVPGLHHEDFATLDIGVVDELRDERGVKNYNMTEMGRWISAGIERGAPAMISELDEMRKEHRS